MGFTIEMALGAFDALGPAQPTAVKVTTRIGRRKWEQSSISGLILIVFNSPSLTSSSS
jgi:hypothetical protein